MTRRRRRRAAAPDVLLNGPRGFEPEATKWQKRSDFVKYIVDDELKVGARADFDHFKIIGNPSILPHLIGPRPSMSTTPPKHMHSDWILIASNPFQIWVPPEYLDVIATFMAEHRGIKFIISERSQFVFSVPIYMADDDFLDMIKQCKITQVCAISYGEKASVNWGRKIMQLCRTSDPSCKITFDFAASLPPEIMHWGRDEHCVPSMPNDDGFVTLARVTDREKMDVEFGKSSRVYNNPMFILAQTEFNMGNGTTIPDFIPCYGGINLELRSTRNAVNKHPNCLEVSMYNSIHHQRRQATFLDLEINGATVQAYKNRLQKLSGDKFLGLLPGCKFKWRIEVTCELPSDADLNKWQQSLGFVWDVVLASWQSISIINIPISFIVKSIERVTSFATSSAVPVHLRAFRGQDSTKVSNLGKDLAALVL